MKSNPCLPVRDVVYVRVFYNVELMGKTQGLI